MPSDQGLAIVHVLGSFEIGGGEQVALNIASAQVRRGHMVHVVSLTGGVEGPHAANFRKAGVQTHTLGKRLPFVDITLIGRIAWLLRKLGTAIVHTHNPLPLIYAGPAAVLLRVRWIHTKHGFNAATARRVKLIKSIGKFADCFVAVSDQTARDALARGECRTERLHVVKNGIDLSQYGPSAEHRAQVRRELGIASHVWLVGTVGRMSDVKNQALLVRAALPLLNQSFQLVLVGDGPHRSKVEQALEHAEARRYVHMLGRRLDVARLLPAFDAFALSSTSEGLPMVLPEAMATGLPIVSTAVGGVPEVVDDGQTGCLVAMDDEAGLTQRLQWLEQHRDTAAAFGAEARRRALRDYSLESMVHKYMGLYGNLGRSGAPDGEEPARDQGEHPIKRPAA